LGTKINYSRSELLTTILTDFKVYERFGGNIMDAFTKGEEVTGELSVEVTKGILHMNYHYFHFFSQDGK
jgi:hypothetical protein